MSDEQRTDRHAQFHKLIEQHKGILIKVARIYCRDEEDRQDLIQEMMIQIWYSLQKYNDQYKISTWLYRISMNVAISFYRKKKAKGMNKISLDEHVSHTEVIDNSEKDEQLFILEQFINELRELDKALMILYLEDKTHAEIAEILGMSVSNVGTKLGRIKETLKKRFSKQTSK